MMRCPTSLIFACLLSILLFIIVPASLAREEPSCHDLGFTNALLCSSCEKLKSFVDDQALQDECLRCCSSDKTEDNTRYPYATLKIDNGLYFFFPRVEQFISERGKEFPGLKIKNRSGVYPTLTLEDEQGKIGETVTGIENWGVHTIADFLKEKLIDGKGRDWTQN